jgi:TRAP-type mannitol/chloroaromatic compound transport system permease small subunit
MAGGAIVISLIAMSVVSIIGRKLLAVVVPGDLELMQMGTAVAVAAFLPYCQMNDGHVRVDFFTARLPERGRALLESVAAILLAASAALIAWRTSVAAINSYESGETSLMLGWPIWYAIAAIVPSFVLLALNGYYIARRRLRTAILSGGAGEAPTSAKSIRHKTVTNKFTKKVKS